MSSQAPPIRLVTVDSTPAQAKEIVATVNKNLKDEYNLVHVANCKSIGSVRTVLTSLITPPHILITMSEWFDEEQEEVRETAQKVAPYTHLIMLPSGLQAQDGEKVVVEYLTEQITESKLPM